MRSQLGDAALYFEFGALGTDVHYQDEEKYWEDAAKIIYAELKKNTSLMAKIKIQQNYNYDVIFRKHIEPLFYE